MLFMYLCEAIIVLFHCCVVFLYIIIPHNVLSILLLVDIWAVSKWCSYEHSCTCLLVSTHTHTHTSVEYIPGNGTA